MIVTRWRVYHIQHLLIWKVTFPIGKESSNHLFYLFVRLYIKLRGCTLQGTNISHLGKRKIIFKMPFWFFLLIPMTLVYIIGPLIQWHMFDPFDITLSIHVWYVYLHLLIKCTETTQYVSKSLKQIIYMYGIMGKVSIFSWKWRPHHDRSCWSKMTTFRSAEISLALKRAEVETGLFFRGVSSWTRTLEHFYRTPMVWHSPSPR